jgi:hypothetical protein
MCDMRRRCFTKNHVEVVESILSSATWTVPLGCRRIDAFVVGGGGGSFTVSIGKPGTYVDGKPGGGGGGGYTTLLYDIAVAPGEQLTFTIGAGGVVDGGNGGASSIKRGDTTLITAGGGYGGNGSNGGNGGSGGGGGYNGSGYGSGGAGGSNGGNGAMAGGDGAASSVPGTGQGTSTKCPFNNTIYAGGGGGGATGGWGDGADGTGGGGDANTGGGGHAGKLGFYPGGSGIIILHYYKYK